MDKLRGPEITLPVLVLHGGNEIHQRVSTSADINRWRQKRESYV
jgi:hypothetical protein